MRRFFTNQPLTEHTTIELCAQSHHHWVRVLRAKLGDEAVLFNGMGGEYYATLVDIHKKSATAQVGAHLTDNRSNSFFTTLAIVISKGERMDYALQKATELGVSNIQLLTSEYTQVRLNGARLDKKLKHWQGVVIAACEQCGLNLVPRIAPPIGLAAYAAQSVHTLKLVLAPANASQPAMNLPLPIPLPDDIGLLIGAEGGLSDVETALANQHGFISWHLGARILRTETAPVVAMSMLMAQRYLNQCVNIA